jgi:hypothetical protein
MKKPTQPFLSGKYITCPKTVLTTLRTKVLVHDEIESPEEFMKTHGLELEEECEILPWSYIEEPFTMEEMSRYAVGLPPEEVRLVLARDRYINYIMVSLVHVRAISQSEIETWNREKEAELAEFEKKQAVYLAEKQKYNLWLLEKEISEKINQLNKKINQLNKLKDVDSNTEV